MKVLEINNPHIVVVKLHPVPRKTITGLEKGSYMRETVLADVIQVGDEVSNVEAGDTIVIGTMKGSTYKEYRLVYDHDFVAVVDNQVNK